MAFLPLDLRQVAMLGDAGANLLGGFLGVALLTVVPLQGRVVNLRLDLVRLSNGREAGRGGGSPPGG